MVKMFIMKNMNKINKKWFKMQFDIITYNNKSNKKVRTALGHFLYEQGIFKFDRKLSINEYNYVTNKIKEIYG